MACYSAKEIQELLIGKSYLQEKLYTNGFLITDDDFNVDGGYPFFNNWSVVRVQGFSIYTDKIKPSGFCPEGKREFTRQIRLPKVF